MARGRPKSIWQDDDMKQVRQIGYVRRLKRNGFAGFSMWDDNVPTAQILSRNRLRRRRAQFAFDLTHLNYREAPFEAFTHLHNIRGMCSRIQSQDTVLEMRRRPALLRRPATAPNGSMRDRNFVPRGAGVCRVGNDFRLRPHSAPLPINASLHCNSHKHPELYDITRNKERSYKDHPPFSRCLKSGSETERNPTSRFDLVGYQKSSGRPPKPFSCCDSIMRPKSAGTSARSVSIASHIMCKMSSSPPCIGDRPPSVHSRAESRCIMRRNFGRDIQLNGDVKVVSSVMKSNQDSDLDLIDCNSTSSDVSDISDLTSSMHIDPPVGMKGVRTRLHSEKDDARHRSEAPIYKNATVVKGAGDYLASSDESPHKESEGNGAGSLRNRMRGQARCKQSARVLDDARQNGMEIKPTPVFNPARNLPLSKKWVGKKQGCRRGNGTSQPGMPAAAANGALGWEKRTQAGASRRSNGNNCRMRSVSEAVEDSHVLVKQSADPYFDFRHSMMLMIREEHLETQTQAMEELFKYYLDINPPVHHAVIKKVIKHIRRHFISENCTNSM